MRWVKDPRYLANGFWRCAIKENEKRRKSYARDPEPKKAKMREYWHNQTNAEWREAIQHRRMSRIRQRIRERKGG